MRCDRPPARITPAIFSCSMICMEALYRYTFQATSNRRLVGYSMMKFQTSQRNAFGIGRLPLCQFRNPAPQSIAGP
jgi:hypothetical protein